MAITREIRRKLFGRAGGRCECEMRVCNHHPPGIFGPRRCPHTLTHGWEAHHRWAKGPNNLGNLIAMCATCHRNTRTYGRE